MPWRRGLQLAWKTVVYAGLSFLCLLVLAWLTLQWGILPHIEDWRPEIERQASGKHNQQAATIQSQLETCMSKLEDFVDELAEIGCELKRSARPTLSSCQ